MIENTLKKLPTTEIEQIIAKAISDRTGEEFNASISTINFDGDSWCGADIHIKLTNSFGRLGQAFTNT